MTLDTPLTEAQGLPEVARFRLRKLDGADFHTSLAKPAEVVYNDRIVSLTPP